MIASGAPPPPPNVIGVDAVDWRASEPAAEFSRCICATLVVGAADVLQAFPEVAVVALLVVRAVC